MVLLTLLSEEIPKHFPSRLYSPTRPTSFYMREKTLM